MMMKSVVLIILVIFILNSLAYVYRTYLNIENFHVSSQDSKLKKLLETTNEKFSMLEDTEN